MDRHGQNFAPTDSFLLDLLAEQVCRHARWRRKSSHWRSNSRNRRGLNMIPYMLNQGARD